MSDHSADSQDSLAAARLIDERCDQFEQAWQQGASPDIEGYLTEVSPTSRRHLLEEILLLDVYYRAKQGDQVRVDDYASRFHDFPQLALEDIIERGQKTPSERGDTPADQRNRVANGLRDDDQRPRYFGDFELLRCIGKGGMGVVYRARQIRLSRLMAVKVILPGLFATEAEVRHFYSQAEFAAQLDHPNIVSIYEVGFCEGHHFVSMTLVDGTSLAARLNNGPVEPRKAAKLVRQVAQAIDYAHNKGVIHGHLKPSNILLDAQGRPRVTGFGLAKRVSLEKALTMSGEILGALSDLSPEQATGRTDAVGPATDVYALGAVLYALLSGRPPFSSNVDTLCQVIGSEPVALRQLNHAIPRDLETIALKCLEKSIARRYASAADLAAELRRYLRGKPILARPISRVRRVWQGCCQFLWTRQS